MQSLRADDCEVSAQQLWFRCWFVDVVLDDNVYIRVYPVSGGLGCGGARTASSLKVVECCSCRRCQLVSKT